MFWGAQRRAGLQTKDGGIAENARITKEKNLKAGLGRIEPDGPWSAGESNRAISRIDGTPESCRSVPDGAGSNGLRGEVGGNRVRRPQKFAK